MRRDVSSKWVVGLTALLVWAAGSGFVAPHQSAPDNLAASRIPFTVGIRVVRPDLVRAHRKAFIGLKDLTGARVETDRQSGAIRVISGGQLTHEAALLSRASAADFEQVAQRFIETHRQALGVAPEDLELDHQALLLDQDVQFLKYRVHRDGLRVQDATVDFRFKRGRLLQVVNQTYAEAATDARAALANPEYAVEQALATSSVTRRGELYRVASAKDGYRLVRVVEFDARTADGARYVVQVEAATGKIFEVRPTRFDLDGAATGQLYPRFYTQPLAALPLGQLTLSYSGGSVTTDLDGHFTGAPDTATPNLDGFVGTHIDVVPETGTKVTVAGTLTANGWSVAYQRQGSDPVSEDKNIAQAMIYYHLSKEINHVLKYIHPAWLDQQLTANANLDQTCNAYWDGTTINLFSAGDGCANTGLIADVMYHEWGHGLDANTGGIEDGAYSEGFGDTMSLMMTHSNLIGPGFIVADGSPVRDLTDLKVYPKDAGEVHDEGQIIGGAYWDLFSALKTAYGEDKAGDMLSNFALKAIYTASKYTDVYNALLVIDDDDGDLTNGTPNYCLINKAFTRHGLATADQSCDLAMIDGFNVDDRAGGNGNGIIEPGETVALWLTAHNAAANPVENLTGHLSVTGAAGATVTDGDLTWAKVPARSTSVSDTPATITLARDVACGTTVHAQVDLAAGSRTAQAQTDLLVGRSVGTADLVQATGLPQPIKDNSTTTATLTIDGTQWDGQTTVQSAHLKFDITHPYIDDVTVKLVAPDGTTKEIFRGMYPNKDEHFDEDVTDAVKGLKGQGTWKLEASDNARSDEGSLDAVTLTVTPANFVCE